MPLSPGTHIGSYEVSALIGAGGMGEVYRARDSRLKREVAIKVLPDLLAGDPERLSRFQREAELLATLNHPNIAAVYGLEESGASRAIVLELVEGETLAEHIGRGALAVDEALRIARQIVDALEAAHDRGVVHRDLKPANIKITPDGKVKVLDFGLAKMLESPATAAMGLSMSPTISIQATYAGVILGTAAYMSPEQARGKPVDRRTDVWAFGCVLFEMLTGRKTFDTSGDTVSDAVAAVLMKEPDWSALPAQTPPHVVSLIRRCLQKDVQKRVPHIGVARLEIDEGPTALAASSPAAALRGQPLWRRAMPFAAGVVLAAAAAGGAWSYARPAAVVPTLTRFSIALRDGQVFSNVGRQAITISPDGTQFAYTADQRLWVRTLSDLEVRPIAGLDGNAPVVNPTFSPDGRSLAFFFGGDQTLKRIAVTGGAPVTLATVTNPSGISWDADGILFGQLGKGVMRVSPNGGTPELLAKTGDGEVAHGPQMLPGRRGLLFTVVKGPVTVSASVWDKAKIVVQLPSGERKILIDGGSDGRYLPTGHLVYSLAGVILAVPLDLDRLEVTGGPVPVIEGVARAQGAPTGATHLAVSANGSLVYIPGPVSLSGGGRVLAIYDRKGGEPQPLAIPAGSLEHPRVSPDGKRVVFAIDDDKDSAVWTYDIAGTTAMRRITFEGRNRAPIWTPDGQSLVFQSDRGGDLGLFRQRADGTGAAERLTTADKETAHFPESWSPRDDGLLVRVTKGGTHALMFYSLRDRKLTPFSNVTSVWPTTAVFSPDGRWVAYEKAAGSDGSNRAVYIEPFPATGARYQVPVVETGGYRHPLWAPDGRDLFFMIGGNVRLMVAGITTQPVFTLGNPKRVPKHAGWADGFQDAGRQWDIMPDGEHFVARRDAGFSAADSGQPAVATIHVVLNWFEELKQRVPTR